MEFNPYLNLRWYFQLRLLTSDAKTPGYSSMETYPRYQHNNRFLWTHKMHKKQKFRNKILSNINKGFSRLAERECTPCLAGQAQSATTSERAWLQIGYTQRFHSVWGPMTYALNRGLRSRRPPVPRRDIHHAPRGTSHNRSTHKRHATQSYM